MALLTITLIIIIILLLFYIAKHKKDDDNGDPKTTGKSYPGTDTVFVGVFLDENNEVGVTTKKEVAKPGEKVIFSSANKFSIEFKEQKTPTKDVRLNSDDLGVLVLKIPESILTDDRFVDEYEKTGEIVFNYDVIIGDKKLDPPLHIKPE